MIISIHLRKCAGTTFRDQLVATYGHKVLFDYGDEVGSSWPTSLDKRKISKEKVSCSIQNLKNTYSIIHGHFYKSKYDSINGNKKYITFLRHPVERLLSNYYYLKRSFDRSNPDSLIVNKLDFSLDEYIRDKDSCNLQSEYLEATSLEGLDFVGITEQYNKSMEKLGSMLDVTFGSTSSRNVNPNKHQDYKINQITKKLILKYNEIDYELYRLGLEKLND